MTDITTTDKQLAIPAGEGNISVHFILDRSGSMQGSEADVIGGFNSFVATLRSRESIGPCSVSVTRFDNVVEPVWPTCSLADVPQMDATHYTPRGSTALLDAVGSTLASVDQPERGRHLAIIHTDGAENASHEWTIEKVRGLIAHLTGLGNWSFAFFGADTDAWSAAESYGMNRKDAMVFAKARMRDAYGANARVAALWASEKDKQRTGSFGKATQAVHDNPDLTDDEVARILDEE